MLAAFCFNKICNFSLDQAVYLLELKTLETFGHSLYQVFPQFCPDYNMDKSRHPLPDNY